MEKRLAKVNISAAGGTAGVGAKTYKITIPSAWMAELDVTENDRQMELSFDGELITIARPISMEAFTEKKKNSGHDLRLVNYYDGDKLCTMIYADFTDKTLKFENYTDKLEKTAFGVNENPSWNDLMGFLEERCIPRGRAGLREYLESIGLDEYDPIEIIQRTAGRMAEDNQWLEIEVVK
jgi:hypothetical protein